MKKIYRITVNDMNPDNTVGELIEIIETERDSWTSIFDFCKKYEDEISAGNEEAV